MIKKRNKNISKLIILNITTFLLVLFGPGTIYKFYLLTKNSLKEENKTSNSKAYYPTYEDKNLSNQIFLEFGKLKTQYRSFVGWRRNKVKFKFTNISGKYNTRKSSGESINNSSWFFGGSTMWGTGASDNQTIPSHFHELTNKNVFNFGETGWASRQSLNQLISLIGDGHIPNQVIFYDGANDVNHMCRSEINQIPSHSYEETFKNILSNNLKGREKRNDIPQDILNFISAPYLRLNKKFNIINLAANTNSAETYNCHIDQNKSKAIAKHLINNWYTAYLISKQNNSKFLGILHPNIFTSDVKYNYFTKSEQKGLITFKKNMNAVYPEILQEIKRACVYDKEFCKSLVDGTDWLKNEENIFIDFAHINSRGNQIIAKEIAKLNNKLNKIK